MDTVLFLDVLAACIMCNMTEFLGTVLMHTYIIMKFICYDLYELELLIKHFSLYYLILWQIPVSQERKYQIHVNIPSQVTPSFVHAFPYM